MAKKTESSERPATHREDPLLNFNEAAPLLGLSASAISEWARRGKLAIVRMPSGRKKIRRSVIDSILANLGQPIEECREEVAALPMRE